MSNDFGDDWHHVLQLEDQMPPAAGAIYPWSAWAVDALHRRTMLAARQDTRSFWGRFPILTTRSMMHMKAWVGQPFDSRAFSLAQVNERLRKRLRRAKKPQKLSSLWSPQSLHNPAAPALSQFVGWVGYADLPESRNDGFGPSA